LDKREAIRLFIKRNSALFNLDPFPGEVFKKQKREFFLNYAKTNVPKDSEIAGEMVEALVTNSQIRTVADLEKMLDLPFFKERIPNRAYYHERLRLKTQHKEPLLDVSKLEEAEYAEQVKEKLRKQAIEEITSEEKNKIEELKEKIQIKKEEYLSLPSILDGEGHPFPEAVTGGEIPDQEDAYSPWWDKLGLKDDPFHSLEGLDKIDRAMWDQIVHKTEIFERYEQIIEKSPKELWRNTVFYGQFGSGKTTFFDYINSRLYENKIYPIYTQLGGEFEVRELIFEFKKRMSMALFRLYTVIIGQGSRLLEALDDEQAIVKLLNELSDHGAKGFVVFIDDLHKGDLDKATRFMSHLQVLASQISRASTQTLNLGFFIAGSPEWEKRMAHDDKFLGSFSHEERMPPLKQEVALDAINRRLRAFAKNPGNPRQLPEAFIGKIFKKLQYAGQDTTFRRVMHEVINEFEAGHFDALSINPIQIPISVLGEIKSSLEKNLILRRRLYRLIYGSKSLKAWQKRRCLELLVDVYLQNGIAESEIREADVAFFQQLHRTGLIVKVEIANKLVWRISQDLWYFNKQIIDRYNLSFEDYLLKIYYADLAEVKQKAKRIAPETEYLESMLSSMKQDLVRELLDQAKELHVAIVGYGDKYLNIEEDPTMIINKCIESLAKLTKAYQAYEKLQPSTNISDVEVLGFWKDFWWSPEIIQQFVRACTSDLEDKKRAASHMISLYREAFPQVFSFLKEEYEKSRQFHIALINLKNDDIKLLHECRDSWIENKYEELADKLARHVERKLRTFLFDIFTVLYGDFDQRMKWVDKDSKKYILKNINKEQSGGFSISRNEFQQLNRAQYKNLMTGEHGSPEGRRSWNCIFSNVFRQWSEKDLDFYLDTFADINVKVSHMKADSMGVPEQDYVYSFMLRSMRFMMDINQAYLRLLTKDCLRYSPPTNACLSLNKFNDDQTLTLINLTKSEAEQIKEGLQGKDKLRIRLDDQEYVEGIVGLSYRKAYALLALLLNQTEEQKKITKMWLEILNSKGCEIYIRLNQVD
jgi:hypothetical protein